MTPIRRVLIANRGEIAVRISRTCRDMGITSIAVFSDADRDAVHTHTADQAVHIGPAPAAQSYLAIPALLEAARKTALLATGRPEVLAFGAGYHGLSLGALPLQGYKAAFTEPFEAMAVATRPETPASPVAEIALAIRPPTG